MSKSSPISHFLTPVSCYSLVLQGLRCEWGAGVLNVVLSLSLSHTGHWKFHMAPHGKELSEDLKKISLKRCKSRAAKIIKNTNHLSNRLFILLPSGKRFRSMMAKIMQKYCSAHYFIARFILYFIIFYFIFFFHTYIYVYSLVFVFHIIALSMEQTWLTFHCWLYSV